MAYEDAVLELSKPLGESVRVLSAGEVEDREAQLLSCLDLQREHLNPAQQQRLTQLLL